jgi:putative sterol carrier protein
LVEPTDWNLEKSFQRLAESLSELGDFRMQVRILDEGKISDWAVGGGSSASAEEGTLNEPQVELATRLETWRLIAEGALAPMEAIRGGQMRFDGDTDVAREVLGLLAGSNDVESDRIPLDLDLPSQWWHYWTGYVEWIKISEGDGCAFTVRDPNSGFGRWFYLWADPPHAVPSPLLQAELDLLRDALVNRLWTSVTYPWWSNHVAQLRVHQPAGG